MKMTMRTKLNRYFYEEFGIKKGDLDIRFKVGKKKYRIRQFCPLWIIMQATAIAATTFMVYWTIALMILVGQIIGG